jgi:hypothetical protein
MKKNLSYFEHDETRKSLQQMLLGDSFHFARRGLLREDCHSGCPKHSDFLARRVFSPRDNHHRVTTQNRFGRLSGKGRCTGQPNRTQYQMPENYKSGVSVQPAIIGNSSMAYLAVGTLIMRKVKGMTGCHLYHEQDHSHTTGGVLCSGSGNQGYHLSRKAS